MRVRTLLLTIALGCCALRSAPLRAQPRVLTLEQALQTARSHAPELTQARANTHAAQARADVARASLLPQVNASARYERATSNRPPRVGQFMPTEATWDSFDNFNFGLSVSQLIYDFGQTSDQWQASKLRAEAEAHVERARLLDVELAVRRAYFDAAAASALVAVARETLDNEQRHLDQITAFVEVGTRPPIDLAQARTDVANTKLALLRAENAYRVAKAQLDGAMGKTSPGDYDVSDAPQAALAGEDTSVELLLVEARKNRPEYLVLQALLRAQEASLSAAQGEYGPSLGANAGVTEGGQQLSEMRWNWNVGVALNWSLFAGGATQARTREARAGIANVRAQLEIREKETRLEIERARIEVDAAHAAQRAADEVVENARVRLGLAEGRYETGVGNAIELGDAQLVLSNARADRVRVGYGLEQARAQLLRALGRH